MEIKTMSNPASNPLFKHFRQPAIYLKLPSGGQYYAEGSIDFPVTGEIPVYPMTVKDELTLKTPDALLNGQGMVDIIQSCCPNIKNAWQVPAVDVDPLFIAIRIASYGHAMDINTECPHCKHGNEHALDLRVILADAKRADFTKPAFINNLKFQFKPQLYKDINDVNLINFEEQRLIDGIINNPDLTDEQKGAMFKESFERLKTMNINTLVVSIESITTEDEVVVTDPKMIAEFIENSSREVYTELKDRITKLIGNNKLQPITLQCEECTKEYTNNLEFDQSNFFG
jgi:hypothetical protein